MSFVSPESRLWSEIKEVSLDEGLLLYDLEKLGNKALRITVESDGADKNGVSIKDCTKLCRRLQVLFAASGSSFGLIEEPEIDVSSPGVNRGLRLAKHFSDSVSDRVKVTFESVLEGKRTVTGILEKFDGNLLSLVDEGTSDLVEVEFSSISKANIDFAF